MTACNTHAAVKIVTHEERIERLRSEVERLNDQIWMLEQEQKSVKAKQGAAS